MDREASWVGDSGGPVITASSPIRQFHTPFANPIFYYVLSITLSIVILLFLYILRVVKRRFNFLPHVFSIALSAKGQRLLCFGINVTMTPSLPLLRWWSLNVFRLAVITVLCFMWQSCVVFQKTMTVPANFNSASVTENSSSLKALCDTGLLCFYYDSPWSILIPWKSNRSDLRELCDKTEGRPSLQKIAPFVLPFTVGGDDFSQPVEQSHVAAGIEKSAGPEFKAAGNNKSAGESPGAAGYLTCLGIPYTSSLSFSSRSAIAYALYQLIVGAYQMGILVIFHSKGQILQFLFLGLACAFLVLYMTALFVPQLYFSDTWFTSVTYLCVPFILLASRSVGLAIRAGAAQQVSRARNPGYWIERLGQELENALLMHSQSASPGVPVVSDDVEGQQPPLAEKISMEKSLRVATPALPVPQAPNNVRADNEQPAATPQSRSFSSSAVSSLVAGSSSTLSLHHSGGSSQPLSQTTEGRELAQHRRQNSNTGT